LENLDGINDLLIIMEDWEKLKKVEGKLDDNWNLKFDRILKDETC
jgi:hypothetical protein